MFHTCKCKIGPSLLASDLSCLKDESINIIHHGADYLHLDIMDGHFVPNITWGAPVIKCLRKHIPNIFIEAHMMVSEPEKWVKDMSDAGVNQFTFHLESTNNPRGLIQLIRKENMKVGIAIKPETNVEAVLPFLDETDIVLIMTVEPGFGGQKFIKEMLIKIKKIRNINLYLDIEVDGGIGLDTIDDVAKAGANLIVAGSSVFKSNDPKNVILLLRQSVEKYGNGKNI